MRKGPCPICSKKPLHELIDLKGRIVGACATCIEVIKNLKRVYQALLDAGLSEQEADRKMSELLDSDGD